MVEDRTTSTPVIQGQPVGNGRTALWILLSVIVGFTLPVCSCAMLLFVGIASLGALGDGTAVSSTGVGDAVAIVEVKGAITSGDEDDVATGAISGVVMADLQTAAEDPAVKAIVLFVDSPGGTVTGSAEIYEIVRDLEKPIVVSMGSVAASGGYYVSAPADYIFARPDTVTGSIGVILTLFNAKELIDDIGVDVITITSGPNKAIGSTWEELTPEQQQILEAFVDESYEDFLQVVADGRNMNIDTVRQIADGRIYTGRQALENGLVDELGNLQAAIQKAANLGGIIGEPRIIEYEHLPTLAQFLAGFSTRLHQNEADEVVNLITEFMTPSLEYRYVGPGSQ